MRFLLFFTLAFLMLSTPPQLTAQSAQETFCFITGQIATTAVAGGALTACSATGNPVTCAVAAQVLTCASDPACDGVVSGLTEAGCNYTISRSGKIIKFTIKTTKENVDKLKQTYNQLNSAEGIVWLGKYLSR